jgi:protein tyrosine/serine phosphatase
VDDRVWRGAAPDAYQAKALVDAGVRTVINLEWLAREREWFVATNNIRVKDFEPLPWFAPSLADEHVVRALAAIRRGPPIVYVHCRSGENRTGVVVAAYRLLERGDTLDVVIRDFGRFKGLWAWGDARYIRSLDARRDDMRRRIRAA